MSIRRKPWVTSGDLNRLCKLLHKMASTGRRITNGTVHKRLGDKDRTLSGVNNELRRIANSISGKAFASDSNKTGRCNVRRDALVEAGFKLRGKKNVSMTVDSYGTPHSVSTAKTENVDGASQYNDDFTHIFTIKR